MAGGDGEGATEFHDYEGGGIGEGEGSKDVSDKIENEDQVISLIPINSRSTFNCILCSLLAEFVMNKQRPPSASEGCAMWFKAQSRMLWFQIKVFFYHE